MRKRIPFIRGTRYHVDQSYQFLDTIDPPSSPWTVPFPLTQFMKWSWKVRKCSFAGVINFNVSIGFGPTTGTISASEVDRYNGVGVIADEAGLLHNITELFPPFAPFFQCGNSGFIRTASNGELPVVWSPNTPPDPHIFLNSLAFMSNISIIYSAPNFYNSMSFAMVFGNALSSPFITATPNAFPAGNIVVDGVNSPLYWINSTFYGGGANTVAFTLTATEYFPYSTSTGSPVYDTVSGAQINDPFS